MVRDSFAFPKRRLQLHLSLNPFFADLCAVCAVHRGHRGAGAPDLARPDNEGSALYLPGGLPLLWCRQKVRDQLAGPSAVMPGPGAEEKHSDPAGISGKSASCGHFRSQRSFVIAAGGYLVPSLKCRRQ